MNTTMKKKTKATIKTTQTITKTNVAMRRICSMLSVYLFLYFLIPIPYKQYILNIT
jgi:membrane-anchored glycerophosphoryl diester phosphodiesterase (GDPDase)